MALEDKPRLEVIDRCKQLVVIVDARDATIKERDKEIAALKDSTGLADKMAECDAAVEVINQERRQIRQELQTKVIRLQKENEGLKETIKVLQA